MSIAPPKCPLCRKSFFLDGIVKLHIGRPTASQGSQEFELLQRLVVEGEKRQTDLETAVERSKQIQQELKEALEKVLREQSKEETEARTDNQPTAEVGPGAFSARDGNWNLPRPIIRAAGEIWRANLALHGRETRYADSGLSLSSPSQSSVSSSPHPFERVFPSSPPLQFERAVPTLPPSRLESEISSASIQQEARNQFSPLSTFRIIDRYPRPNSPFLEIETLPSIQQGARNHFSNSPPLSLQSVDRAPRPSSRPLIPETLPLRVRQDARNRIAPLSRSRQANDRSSQPNSPPLEFETLPSALQEPRNSNRLTSTPSMSPQLEVNNRATVEKLVPGRKRRVR